MAVTQITGLTGFLSLGPQPAFFERRVDLSKRMEEATEFDVADVTDDQLKLFGDGHLFTLDNDSIFSGAGPQSPSGLAAFFGRTENAFHAALSFYGLDQPQFAGASTDLIIDLTSVDDPIGRTYERLGPSDASIAAVLEGEPRPTEWRYESAGEDSHLMLRLHSAEQAAERDDLPWNDPSKYPEVLASASLRTSVEGDAIDTEFQWRRFAEKVHMRCEEFLGAIYGE